MNFILVDCFTFYNKEIMYDITSLIFLTRYRKYQFTTVLVSLNKQLISSNSHTLTHFSLVSKFHSLDNPEHGATTQKVYFSFSAHSLNNLQYMLKCSHTYLTLRQVFGH